MLSSRLKRLLLWYQTLQQECFDSLSYNVRAIFLILFYGIVLCFRLESCLGDPCKSCRECSPSESQEKDVGGLRMRGCHIYDKQVCLKEFHRKQFHTLCDERGKEPDDKKSNHNFSFDGLSKSSNDRTICGRRVLFLLIYRQVCNAKTLLSRFRLNLTFQPNSIDNMSNLENTIITHFGLENTY